MFVDRWLGGWHSSGWSKPRFISAGFMVISDLVWLVLMPIFGVSVGSVLLGGIVRPYLYRILRISSPECIWVNGRKCIGLYGLCVHGVLFVVDNFFYVWFSCCM